MTVCSLPGFYSHPSDIYPDSLIEKTLVAIEKEKHSDD